MKGKTSVSVSLAMYSINTLIVETGNRMFAMLICSARSLSIIDNHYTVKMTDLLEWAAWAGLPLKGGDGAAAPAQDCPGLHGDFMVTWEEAVGVDWFIAAAVVAQVAWMCLDLSHCFLR